MQLQTQDRRPFQRSRSPLLPVTTPEPSVPCISSLIQLAELPALSIAPIKAQSGFLALIFTSTDKSLPSRCQLSMDHGKVPSPQMDSLAPGIRALPSPSILPATHSCLRPSHHPSMEFGWAHFPYEDSPSAPNFASRATARDRSSASSTASISMPWASNVPMLFFQATAFPSMFRRFTDTGLASSLPTATHYRATGTRAAHCH